MMQVRLTFRIARGIVYGASRKAMFPRVKKPCIPSISGMFADKTRDQK